MSFAVATMVQQQPATQPYPQRNSVPSTPGSFRHPRLDEITKRRNATQFTDRNVQTIGINAVVLLATYVVPLAYLEYLVGMANTYVKSKSIPVQLSSSVLVDAVRLLLVVNILLSLRPLTPLASRDDLDDIPLTPSQRKLLGLPLSSRSSRSATGAEAGGGSTAGPAGGYITPPRYRRSSPSPALSGTGDTDGTTRSDSAQYGGSPLSVSRRIAGFSPTPKGGTPASNERTSGMFSPANAVNSPLLNRVLNKSASHTSMHRVSNNNNNISFISRDEDADFSQSTQYLFSNTKPGARKSTSGPDTPSPRSREKVRLEPGVNYKWLYDKGLKADGSPGGVNNFS